mmetsp:Transcript_3304/g.7770  ORF Transcript_3304/g.7770 Transcript_3304/m.7770 type:complete len:225 (-) Transcript_3304:460-1134(-)|eukprot:1691600-Rhodomonas_salina.2
MDKTPDAGDQGPKGEERGKTEISAAEATKLNPAEAKEKLNTFVRSLKYSVRDNWHDGYEEQAEQHRDWFECCLEHVDVIVSVSVQNGVLFHESHEILKLIADTSAAIDKLNFRCDGIKSFDGAGNLDLELSDGISPQQLLDRVWPLLLLRVATDSSVTELALLQMIRDASDRGVTAFEPHAVLAAKLSPELLKEGASRLGAMVARMEEEEALSSDGMSDLEDYY